MLLSCRGGQVRPLRFQFKNLLVIASLAVCGLLTVLPQVRAQSPQFERFKQRSRQVRQNHPSVPRPNLNRADPAVVQLLKQMTHPGVDFSGEQVVETQAMGGHTARLSVWGDAKGHIRRDYVAPDALRGDFTIVGPRQYRKYHHRTNTLDVALWPSDDDSFGGVRLNLIRSGKVKAQLVGQEIIAGRNASIIELVAEDDASGMGRNKKLWVDTVTGLRLKTESSGANGLISRTYFTSITIGPDAGVTPKIFDIPNQKQMKINALFPGGSHFNSLAEAQNLLPFTPLVPAMLPNNFRLFGVWILEGNAKKPGSGNVLLGYTDGVSNFTLFERRANPNRTVRPNTPLQFKGHIQNWPMVLTDSTPIDVTYIGHLSAEKVSALHDSLH